MSDDVNILSQSRKEKIAEEIFAEKFSSFIDDQIRERSECFNGNTINMLLNLSVSGAVDKLVDKYSDRLLEKIDSTWKDPNQYAEVYLKEIVINEAVKVFDHNADEVRKEIYTCMTVILRQVICGSLTDQLISRLTDSIKPMMAEAINSIME